MDLFKEMEVEYKKFLASANDFIETCKQYSNYEELEDNIEEIEELSTYREIEKFGELDKRCINQNAKDFFDKINELVKAINEIRKENKK